MAAFQAVHDAYTTLSKHLKEQDERDIFEDIFADIAKRKN